MNPIGGPPRMKTLILLLIKSTSGPKYQSVKPCEGFRQLNWLIFRPRTWQKIENNQRQRKTIKHHETILKSMETSKEPRSYVKRPWEPWTIKNHWKQTKTMKLFSKPINYLQKKWKPTTNYQKPWHYFKTHGNWTKTMKVWSRKCNVSNRGVLKSKNVTLPMGSPKLTSFGYE